MKKNLYTLLALTMAVMMIMAGCSKKEETTTQPEVNEDKKDETTTQPEVSGDKKEEATTQPEVSEDKKEETTNTTTENVDKKEETVKQPTEDKKEDADSKVELDLMSNLVEKAEAEGALLFIKAFIFSSFIVIPEGRPSMTTPIASECDCPKTERDIFSPLNCDINLPPS